MDNKIEETKEPSLLDKLTCAKGKMIKKDVISLLKVNKLKHDPNDKVDNLWQLLVNFIKKNN